MQCPKCKTKIEFGKQMKEWEKMWGKDANLNPDFPIMISLDCYSCEKPVAMVYIETVIKEKMVKSPLGKVIIPITKSTNYANKKRKR